VNTTLMSALPEAAQARDFDGLFRHHAPSVYRYTYAVLGNHADAEDVTQQTFLNAYRACARGTKPRKAENWLLTIAHNELRQHFRATGRKPVEVALDEEAAEQSAERIDPSLADVLGALKRLPPAQRSAIVRREFEGRTYAEIAESMGMSRSALEALTFRARRALALELEEAFTCGEAEDAVVRRLHRRLPRRVARRLKAHLEGCRACVSFDRVQRRQRGALGGLSVLPIPASLFLVRAKEAAAAVFGPTNAAAGGTAAAGAGSSGIAASLVAKVAAATAAATVAGGVGYGVTTPPDRSPNAGRAVEPVAAMAASRSERPTAELRRARAEPISVRAAAAPAPQERRNAKPKARPTRSNETAKRLGAHRERTGPPLRKAHPVTRRAAKTKPESPRVRPAPSGSHGPKPKSPRPNAKVKAPLSVKSAPPPKPAAQPKPDIPGKPDAKKSSPPGDGLAGSPASPPPSNGNPAGEERKR
jgi:RNA polymerase sigma-70 factor, ECF subfamily